MAAERTVVVRLIGMVGQYRAAMAESAAATRALDSQMLATSRVAANATRGLAASQQAALGGMASTMRSMRGMMLGLGVPLAIGAMAKSFFQFEQQMAHTKAVADSFGQSATGFKALSDAALTMGQRFGFSAVEVGQAQEALVKAGRTTAQVLGGELSAALTLAAAGTISLEEAARITAVTMTVFQKEGVNAATVADTLTGAANATVSGVQEMGNALSYVGPLAASLGVSFKDTVATISVFNQAGIEGERAGTNLRGMLTNLLSPSAMARKEMTRLGIDLFDATGKFVGMSEAAQILHDQVGSLGGREQAEAVGRLTTNASMPGFITLMKLGAAGVDEMKRKIAESATAEQVAAQKLDSVTGEFKKLGAAVEAASIKVGATMAPALGDLAKGLTTVTHGFGDMSGASQLAMVALGAQLLLARRVSTAMRGTGTSIGEVSRAYQMLRRTGGNELPAGALGPRLPGADQLRGTINQAGLLSRTLGTMGGAWSSNTNLASRFGAVGAQALNGVSGAAKGLIGFLGGPFGVALAAATVGFAIWQAKVADNKRVADGFHAGLTQLGAAYRTTGAVSDENVKAMFRENEQMQWLITNSGHLGLSMDTLTKAAAGHGGSVEDASRALGRYERQVEAVRKSVQAQAYAQPALIGIMSQGTKLSADNLAKLAAIGVKPKSADWNTTEIDNTVDRLNAVARNAKDAREEFEKTHRAEALLAKAMDELNTTRMAGEFAALGTTADDASAGMTAMATNLAVMGAAESEFSDRINAMTSNVGMLASAFHSVADAQSAFFAASQEGLADAFREDVEQLTGGGGTQKYGVSTTSEESSSQRVTAGKAAQDKVQVIRGGRAPKTPVPDKVSTTQNPDGTTTTVTTKTAADGTRTVTTHRSGIAAGSERERTRQRVTTDRRPDGTTVVTTTTTDAAGNKTVDSRTSHDPNDARKAVGPKPATPTRYVPPKVDAVTGQLDVSTATGRKQHAAMTGMADASAKTVTDTFTQVALAGKNTGEAMEFAGLVATASFAKQRDAAIKALQAVGMNKDMARQLVDAYYALPAEVATRVNAEGAEETLADLGKLHIQLVTLPQGKVALVTDSPARARELAALGGAIKKLPNGKFRIDFANQTQAHTALDKVIAKTKPRKLSIKAVTEAEEAKAELATLEQQLDNLRDGVDIWLATHKDHAEADLTAFAKAADAQDGRIVDYYLRLQAYSSTAATSNARKAEAERREREAATLTRDPESRMGRPQPPTATPKPPSVFDKYDPTKNRWGGLYEARNGLLSGAQLGTSGPLYQWAEPATGGEAFIPRRGQRGRSMAILDKAASWYGASVQSGPAWKGANLSKAAPGQVQITVRGEGVLSGMIEATVDGRLVKVAQAVSNGRVR